MPSRGGDDIYTEYDVYLKLIQLGILANGVRGSFKYAYTVHFAVNNFWKYASYHPFSSQNRMVYVSVVFTNPFTSFEVPRAFGHFWAICVLKAKTFLSYIIVLKQKILEYPVFHCFFFAQCCSWWTDRPTMYGFQFAYLISSVWMASVVLRTAVIEHRTWFSLLAFVAAVA